MGNTVKAAVAMAILAFAAAGWAGGVRPAPIGRLAKIKVYDSGVVAAGAAIDSGVIDIAHLAVCSIYADNAAGSVSRLMTPTMYLDDGTTAITDTNYGGGANCPNGRKGCMITIGIPVGTAGVNNAGFYVLTDKARFQFAAGGSADGRLVVYCQ